MFRLMHHPGRIGKRRRGWALSALACLGAVGFVQWVAAASGAVILGRPEITLSGTAAPPPSSSVCGLVLVARDAGPQVLATERPATVVISLQAQEDAEIAIPVGGLEGEVSACATVTAVETGDAEVVLSLSTDRVHRANLREGPVQLTVSAPAADTGLVLRLRTTAGAGSDHWSGVGPKQPIRPEADHPPRPPEKESYNHFCATVLRL